MTSPTLAAPPTTRPKLDRRYIVAALMLVMILASMEATVTSTAMPTIIGILHGVEHYSWVASVYLLASTVVMPLYGRLADVLGRKRVLVFSILFFAAGSVAAGQSHSMVELIIFRGVQGLGAGGIMPVVLTILGDLFTLQERAKMQGLFSAVWGTASIAGPLLGAAIIGFLNWRWIFYINLPFGILGLAVLFWKYHDHETPHATDLDIPGTISLAFACLSLLALVSGMATQGLWLTIACAAIVPLAVGFFVWNERRHAHAIMPPALMISRAIGPTMIGSFLLGLNVFAIDVYCPLYVQVGRGLPVAYGAGVITPVMLAWASSSLFAAPLVLKWGFRKLAVTGSLLITLGLTGLVVCAVLHAPYAFIVLTLLLTGMGFGPTSLSYLLAAQQAVGYQQRGIITSSIAFFRTIGGAIGVGLLGTFFMLKLGNQIQILKQNHVAISDLIDPERRKGLVLPPTLVDSTQHAIAQSLTWVFGSMVILAVVQVLTSLQMSKAKAAHAISRVEALESAAG